MLTSAVPEENMNMYFESHLSTEHVQKELAHPDSFFYFLMVNNDIAGYSKLNIGTAQSEPLGDQALEIERIYLVEAWQGKGLGGALMNHALEQAKELHKTSIWLGVWEHNDHAIGFYERYGFKKVGEHEFLLGTDLQLDYIFEKSLV